MFNLFMLNELFLDSDMDFDMMSFGYVEISIKLNFGIFNGIIGQFLECFEQILRLYF